MAIVSFHPLANDELTAATEWYLARSYSAALRFAHEIQHAVERIAESPERYPLTRYGRRRFVLISFPYDVVYRITASEIEIVAVAHHARRPGYWKAR